MSQDLWKIDAYDNNTFLGSAIHEDKVNLWYP